MPDPNSPPDPPQTGSLPEGLGRAIKVRRTGLDLSRKELAQRAGLSYSYLAEIEKGMKSPSPRTLAAIAAGLGLPLHELLESAETWRTPLSEDEPLYERVFAYRSRGSAAASDERIAADGASALEETLGESELQAEVLSEEVGAPAVPSRPRALEWPATLRLGVPLRATQQLAPRAKPRNGVPPALLEEIQAGHCVAFVGAGFSAAAKLPAWGELLKKIAAQARVSKATMKHVKDRVSGSSAYALDEAAQVLEDEIGRPGFLAQLEGLLGNPPLTDAMAQRVRWLHGIPFRSILTTNFDGLLAGATPSHEAYREALRPDAYRWWEPRYWGAGEGAFTLKLHGDLRQDAPDDSIVLTRRDYRRRLYEDPAYETFLRAVMATTTVLYMGFSFEDAYLNELRSEILALLGQRQESAPVAYAIVNDVPEDTRRHFRHHEGIEILSYDTQGGKNFSGFDAYLASIHEATNPLLRFARYLEHKRILWVDPHPENNELAFEHLAQAANAARRAKTALVTAATADDGLRELERKTSAPFDLVITHWGERAARDDAGRTLPTAVRLLTEMRSRDLRCPVAIFAADTDVERRKHAALGLGAQAYCHTFEALYRTIERVLSPGEES